MRNKYSFYYDNGVEGGLSVVHFEAETEGQAWVKWKEFDNLDCLEVRLVLLNMDENNVVFKE